MKKNLRTYSFWVSVGSGLILIAKTIAEVFGLKINDVALNASITSVCGFLVVVGILTNTTITEETKTDDVENDDEDDKEADI